MTTSLLARVNRELTPGIRKFSCFSFRSSGFTTGLRSPGDSRVPLLFMTVPAVAAVNSAVSAALIRRRMSPSR